MNLWSHFHGRISNVLVSASHVTFFCFYFEVSAGQIKCSEGILLSSDISCCFIRLLLFLLMICNDTDVLKHIKTPNINVHIITVKCKKNCLGQNNLSPESSNFACKMRKLEKMRFLFLRVCCFVVRTNCSKPKIFSLPKIKNKRKEKQQPI